MQSITPNHTHTLSLIHTYTNMISGDDVLQVSKFNEGKPVYSGFERMV